MDRLHRLEKEWLFYKLRQYSKSALFLLIALIVGGVSVYVALSSQEQPEKIVIVQAEPEKVAKKDIVEEATEEKAVVVPDQSKKTNRLTIAPSFEFENEIASRNRPVAKAPQPVQKEPAKQALTITRVGSTESMIKGYEEQPSYSKAVAIAQRYLQSDPQEALNWALKANKFDSQDEQSWEIFAKANYQLGKKKQAVDALRAYLDVKQSAKLSKLLEEMEN